MLLAAWYSSPFWAPWYVVILSVILYHIQLYYAKGCLITKGQFGSKNDGFYYYYLTKFGFHPDKAKLSFVLDYIIPGTIIVIALLRRFL